MIFEDKVKSVIELVKDKDFIVKNKTYNFTEQQLKDDFTWDDINSKDGIGYMIFNGNYVILPLEKLIFC